MKAWYLVFLLIITCSTASADELHLVLSGKAFHFNTDDSWNEKNWGVGFEYDFDREGNWIPLITGLTFKDSNKKTSRYLGGGVKRRFDLSDDPDGMHLDTGLIAFAMTRYDHNDNKPFIGVLPFVSIGNNRFSANITYVPGMSPKMVPFLYIQGMIKLAEF